MLSTLQIILLSVTGFLAFLSVIFMVMFIVEISVKKKEAVKKVSVKKVIEITKEEDTQITVDEMLENLEKEAKEEDAKVEAVSVAALEEVKNEIKEEIVEEQPAEEVVEVENSAEEVVEEQPVDAEEVEEIKETVEIIVEASPEEKTEEPAELEEEVAEEKSDDEDEDESDDDEISDDDLLAYQKLTPEIVLAPGTVIDYKARLEKVIKGRAKIERDLTKIQKFILKYERTERRKDRNQKMLDRRAGELTNLNLVMYSVTDIKNVDEEKKVKQEELTAHIAELKASIQDAEEYLDSNREKYNHNQKMAKFLSQERVRYSEEIVELEALIKAADENK